MTATTPTAPKGGTAPPEDPTDTAYAPYVPHDLQYNADFEDSLIDAVLHPTSRPTGIRVIPDDSDEKAVEGESIRLSSILPNTLPTISEAELPLALNDPRRIFAGPIPGINLTHPGGYIEGGPGLDPEMDTFPEDFLNARPGVKTPAQLQKAINKEMESAMELLKERLSAREQARQSNEVTERELRALKDQHSMELRIHNRMQEDMARKKAAREKRKKDVAVVATGRTGG